MHTRYMELDYIEAELVVEARKEGNYLIVLDNCELSILEKYVDEMQAMRELLAKQRACEHDWPKLTDDEEHRGVSTNHCCGKCGMFSIW